MFWKAYFWACLALAAYASLGAALRPHNLTWVDWIDLAAFTPVALGAVLVRAFNRWVLPPSMWKVLLFATVFWKSITLGIGAPKLVARAVDLNARVSLMMAEGAIFVAIGLAIFLTAPPLIALYLNGYPDGDGARIRLPGPGRRSRAAA
jgi:hypothetical protein